MAEFGFGVEEVARLVRLVAAQDLDELIVEEEGERLVIRGAHYAARTGGSSVASPVPHYEEADEHFLAQPPRLAGIQPAVAEDRIAIEAPVVGVFYRAAKADSPPFVEVGDRVQTGQTIGLIEAMKVFSEIQSERAGTVVEVVAQNGQLVRVGEPLLYLKA